jgi:hypothetical protein
LAGCSPWGTGWPDTPGETAPLPDTADTSSPADTADTTDTADTADTAGPDCEPTGPEEPYDGIDQDCDPTTPDDDLDGDGIGVGADCDDRDAAVGAEVRCLNRARADLRIEGTVGLHLGSGLFPAGDLDGDGVAELLVGAEDADSWRGQVLVFSGAALAPGAALLPGDALVMWAGSAEYDSVGGAEEVALLDGAAVLLACPSADPGGFTNVGEVYLLRVEPADLDGGTQAASAAADVRLQGGSAGDRFGQALGVADVDGDGLQDVLVGASRDDGGHPEGGVVALFTSLPAAGTVSVDDADARLSGAYLEALGQGVLRAGGDLDGDGRPDLVVAGAGLDDPVGTNPGRVYLLAGTDVTTGDIAGLAFATLAGGVAGDGFGATGRSLGDLDGDGADELVLAALTGDVVATNGGGLYLWRGGSGLAGNLGPDSAELAWGSPEGLARAGGALEAADVDRDGALDLLAATPWATGGGRVALLAAAEFDAWQGASLEDDAALRLGTFEEDAFGSALLATDLDGAGALDLAVGAPQAAGGAGGVYGFLQ